MAKTELALDELPAPGEPLKPKIHEDNQKLLDEEIQARAARVRAKLTRAQHAKLTRRYNQLHSQLNRIKWNTLTKERWELYQQYQRLQHDLKAAKDKRRAEITSQIKEIQKRGQYLDGLIKKHRPTFDEFQAVIGRLKAHREVVAWEKEDRENKAAFSREAKVWLEQIKATCRRSARLHHAWEDERGRRRTDIPKFSRIVFKDDRVLYHIKTTSQNPILRFFGKWKDHLPYNVDISDLTSEETLQNLSAATGRVVTAEWSKNSVNLFWVISRLDSPDGIPRRVLYEKILDYYPSEDHAKTPWAAGITNDRKVKWFNFQDQPHILIAGTTQSGKSNHVNQMIATMVTMHHPNELRMVLIDNKGGVEFTHWRGMKHLLMPMVKSAGDVPKALKYIRIIMERRLAAFESIGAKNLESYNEKVKDRIPRIVAVIDEMATLVGLGDLTNEIHTELRVISSQGRAVGVHLILCTQHPSFDVIPGWVKTNMGVRICGKMPSHVGSQIVLDSVTAATLPDVPGRLVFSLGRNEVIAQSPFISDASIARAVQLSKEYPEPNNEEFDTAKPVERPKPKFTEEDAIEIAMTVFEGQLSPTKIYKHVGAEVITDKGIRQMVDDIIERGFMKGIEYGGKKYKPKKIRKYHILVPVEEPVEPKADDTSEVEAIHYNTTEEAPA